MKNLLPIGSVVQLFDGEKKIMITGYSSKNEEKNKVFDYNGCIFPEGIMEDVYCLFDSSEIETVYFKGLETQLSVEYISKINSMMGVSDVVVSKEKEDTNDKKQAGRYRTPKAPTRPMSASEMKVRYGVAKSSKENFR